MTLRNDLQGVANKIAQEVKEWEICNPDISTTERYARVGLVALGVLMIIGMAIAIYFCATTTHEEYMRFFTGDHIVEYATEVTNACYVPLPLLGLMLGGTMVAAGLNGSPKKLGQDLGNRMDAVVNPWTQVTEN